MLSLFQFSKPSSFPKMRNPELMVACIFFLLPLLTHGLLLDFNQSLYQNKMQPAPSNQQDALLSYVIQRNVNRGLFVAVLRTGQPLRDYRFLVDTGSDLTWIDCTERGGAHRAPSPFYTPHNNFLPKTDPFCPFPLEPGQRDRCESRITYADGSSFRGWMVRDNFQLYDNNRRPVTVPSLAFGYGTYTRAVQQDRMKFDGLLGLGKSKFSFPSQLKHLGLTKNVHGHCLSRHGSGFGFFGSGLALSARPVWLRMKPTINHYVIGPATLSLDNIHSRINNIDITLDSGTTLTYLNSTFYGAVRNMVQGSLRGTPLSIDHADQFFPVCWKLDRQDITNIDQVKRYFKPIKLDFTEGGIITLQPEDYLIISKKNYVCFGILYKESFGDKNILGAISMLEKLVIYDNERGLVGRSPIPVPNSCAHYPPRLDIFPCS